MAYIGRTPTGSILTGADIADGSISTAKLADTAVSTAKIADDAVGNTKLNLSDNYAFTGTVTGAGGITMADQWRTTSDISSDTDPITNLERNDSAYFSKIGSGMSESSGTFTFPQTGIYQIYIQSRAQAAQDTALLSIKLTTNNSSYSESSYGTISLIDAASGALAQAGIFASIIFDVTDTTTHKCRFATGSMANAVFYGDTNTSLTAFTFIRLGDT